MSPADNYLIEVISKYPARDLSEYSSTITTLKTQLTQWAGTCFIEIKDSGSRAKGTAIHLASDVDFLVSLTSNCNSNSGGLQSIYESLVTKMETLYPGKARKQNVSVRLNLNGLEIDVTPAKKQTGQINYHSIWVSKLRSWRQTNIQKHITDISQSGRLNEIKVLKIWREIHKIDFPSIYLEYLIINNILYNKAKGLDYLAANVWFVLQELAKDSGNPLNSRIVDPANSTNILSELLTPAEKLAIKMKAKEAFSKATWGEVVW